MRRYRVSGNQHNHIKDIAKSDRFAIERDSAYTYKTRGKGSRAVYSTTWEPIPWSEIDSVSWGRVKADKDGGWIVPRYLQWGDYGGSTCERSNYEVFQEEFASDRQRPNGKPNWLELYGDFGSHGIAVSISFYLSEAGDSVREFLLALEDYPLADDEHHSNLEMKLQEEAWTDYGLSDLRRELSERCEDDSDDRTAFEDDSLPWAVVLSDELYNQDYDREAGRYVSELCAARERNEPHCEDAVSCHLPIDRWVAALSDEYIAYLVTTARETINAWSIKGAYACLGCRETSAKGPHGTQERLINAGRYECHYPGCPDQDRPGLATTTSNDDASKVGAA
jgi:hypothetical protein